jgi:hypothetical protein
MGWKGRERQGIWAREPASEGEVGNRHSAAGGQGRREQPARKPQRCVAGTCFSCLPPPSLLVFPPLALPRPPSSVRPAVAPAQAAEERRGAAGPWAATDGRRAAGQTNRHHTHVQLSSAHVRRSEWSDSPHCSLPPSLVVVPASGFWFPFAPRETSLHPSSLRTSTHPKLPARWKPRPPPPRVRRRQWTRTDGHGGRCHPAGKEGAQQQPQQQPRRVESAFR